ncbi:hypothetical protein DPMN_186684 [Dreissena polymorpha]|uniref:PDZ domain-containing protein n=1 Tax=Dreissena polymorpha TaxID=45954 RepID=A0A9D4DQS1_DREPO|nr:hypothetical protein DPMN_186684 [Dreissena polymorpha]
MSTPQLNTHISVPEADRAVSGTGNHDLRNSSNQQRNSNGLNPDASSFFPDRTVTPGSVAANSNSLAPGDVVLKIGNVNATNIRHNEAQEVVCGSTNILQLTIKKGPGKSASMSPTPIGSGQFSTPLEQRDKYSTLPDYRIETGYQALNNVSSGYNNGQEIGTNSANLTSGIQLQLNPPTQIDIRNDNSYNQRGDYNDGGISVSKANMVVQITSPTTAHSINVLKGRRRPEDSQLVIPGFQSCSYMSDEPPPTPPPPDLSTDSFLQAFRRFASRKSLPTVMVLHNATTYIAASNHLKRLFNYQVVQEELSRNGTESRFIPKRTTCKL